jgi:hypothetical protein
LKRASFKALTSKVVVQEIAADYAAYADKVALKADSILVRLDEHDFEAGIRALRSSAATMKQRPVTEPIDFLVFGKH